MIQEILKLTRFTNEFHKIKRVIYINGTNELESDSEHTFQLALLAWYIIDLEKLKLNSELVLKYCLIHDLVEIYAGDTFVHEKNKAYADSKAEREKAAAYRIESEFKEFIEMNDLMKKYEEKSDEESMFVYVLDKIMPVLNLYVDGGKMWHEKNITYEEMRESKDAKIAMHPLINKYWQEFVKLIEKDKDKLFPKK